jgi:putative ABC transport system permease protein
VSTNTLVWRNLLRHPARAALTFLFAALALFLFVFLRSTVTTLRAAVSQAASNRLATQSAVSLFVAMPQSYRARIAQVPGVESVGPWTWFGGWHKDDGEFWAQFAVDRALTFDQYPELVVPDDQRAALLADRQGAMIGVDLAREFDWEVGDRVAITSRIYGLPGKAWEFNIRAVYRSTKPNLDEKTMFFSDEYFQDERDRFGAELGLEASGQDVNVYMVKVADGHRSEDVGLAIDAVYENGPQKTRTQTEAAFQAQFVSMMGNIPVFLAWIGGAVLFAIFFSVLNTAQMASRERARDVGILKALGFSDGLAARLLLAEALLIVGAGGVVGTALGFATQSVFRRLFGTQIPNYFVEPATLAMGVGVALAIGFLGGLFPAMRLARLRPVQVFREEG